MAVAHKGAISFGLVHIPIQMYRTTRDVDISFNQLCKKTHERVHYKKYCGHCDKELRQPISLRAISMKRISMLLWTMRRLTP